MFSGCSFTEFDFLVVIRPLLLPRDNLVTTAEK